MHSNTLLEDAFEAAVTAPTRCDCFRRLASLATRRGEHALAARCWLTALQADDVNPHDIIMLGNALATAGRREDALSAYLRALIAIPESAEIHAAIGKTLQALGRSMEAMAFYTEALRLDPMREGVARCIGDLLLSQGRLSSALRYFAQARSQDPEDAEVYGRLGQTCLRSGEWSSAVVHFKRGLELQRGRVEFLIGMSQAFSRQNMLPQARTALRTALAIAPNNVAACHRLVSVLSEMGGGEELAYARLALGKAFESHGAVDEATRCYREVVESDAHCLPALIRLGDVYERLGKPCDVIRYMTLALTLAPGTSQTHRALGRAYHLLGDPERGWAEFLASWQTRSDAPWGKSRWNGESVAGRTVLVWADQALGDTIQYGRYIQHLKKLDARVIVQCSSILVPLFERLDCVDCAVAAGVPPPAFDVHVPIALLPMFVPIARAEIPAEVAYLSVEESLVQAWCNKLGPSSGLRVGIVWGGHAWHYNAAAKFVTLAHFSVLGSVIGARFINLQIGDPAADLLKPPPGLIVENYFTDTPSICDTAALMVNLDLVITVDTMAAHLAGALGKPVWTLVPFAPHWSWLNEGEETPWYPTMRLFRQTRRGDWPGVFARLQAALREHVGLQATA